MPENLGSLKELRKSLVAGQENVPAAFLDLISNYENLLVIEEQIRSDGKPVPDELRRAVQEVDIAVQNVKLALTGQGASPEGRDRLVQHLEVFITHVVQDTVPPLARLFARRMKLEPQSVQKMLPGVTITHDPIINCGLEKGMIHLYSGLVVFLMHLGKVYSKRTTFVDSGKHAVEPVSIEDTGLAVRSLLEVFWRERATVQMPGEFENLQKTQAEFADYLFRIAMSFIFGHELGHLVMQVSKALEPELTFGLGITKTLPALQIAGTSAGQWRQDWAEEIAADLIGLQFAEDLWFEKNPSRSQGEVEPGRSLPNLVSSDPAAAYAGMTMFFVGFDLLEQYGHAKRHCELPGPSHPPAVLRLARLMQYITEKRDSSVIKRVETYKNILRDISSRVGVKLLSQEEFLRAHLQA